MRHYLCESCDEVNDRPGHPTCSLCGDFENVCRYCGNPAISSDDVCERCLNDEVLNETVFDEDDEEFLRGPYSR